MREKGKKNPTKQTSKTVAMTLLPKVLVFSSRGFSQKQEKSLFAIWTQWWQNSPSLSLQISPHIFTSAAVTCFWLCWERLAPCHTAQPCLCHQALYGYCLLLALAFSLQVVKVQRARRRVRVWMSHWVSTLIALADLLTTIPCFQWESGSF